MDIIRYYSWSFGVWVRFLYNFPKTGKLQGTPEILMRTHRRSPSTGSLVCFYLFSCFTVYFMFIVVWNCWYLLGVLQMKNWWWGQQRINLCWTDVATSTSTGTDPGTGLGCNTRWGMRRGRTSGGGWVMTELYYCFLTKKQNFLIICQALPFQAEIHYYIKANALLLTE